MLSRQPARGWPFQQRHGVVEAQPARGWHPRQRTGHDGRSCLEYFQSFPGALLECCFSCGIASATEPLLPQGSSNRQAGARPKGANGSCSPSAQCRHWGNNATPSGERESGGVQGTDVCQPQASWGDTQVGRDKEVMGGGLKKREAGLELGETHVRAQAALFPRYLIPPVGIVRGAG